MDTVQLTYQYKKNLKLPHIHQKNLLARILEEQTAKDTMRWLKWGVIAGLALSLINFVLNGVLVALKMLYL